MKNINAGDTMTVYLNTVDSTGAAVAPSAALAASDFSIYKDGSAVQKTTTNGITVTSPFDSKVGCHKIDIDTSNETGDVGFWPTGSLYEIILNTTKTADSVSLDGLRVETFGIEYGYMRGTNGANTVVPPTLLQFIQTDTGETTAVAGSVAKIAQGAAGGSVQVSGFDQPAIDQISGSVIRFNGPSWTGSGWDQDFIVGDSYIGGLRPTITIENWDGDQLISAAAELKLSGTRTVAGVTTTFEFALVPADVTEVGITTTIYIEATAAQTAAIAAGEYTADLRAKWTTNSEFQSLIQPTFKLVFRDPVTTF